MVLSLIVVFLYGSLVWGLFPIQPQISWESHLLGSLAGSITAFYFRKEGPQAKRIKWNEDEEDSGEWSEWTPSEKIQQNENQNPSDSI